MGTFPPIASVLLQLLHSCFLPTPAPRSQPVQAALCLLPKYRSMHCTQTSHASSKKQSLKLPRGDGLAVRTSGQVASCIAPAQHCVATSTALHCNLHTIAPAQHCIATCTALQPAHHCVATCTPLQPAHHCIATCTAQRFCLIQKKNKIRAFPPA